MHTNEYDFQIYRLTDDFYNIYPQSQYPEILDNRARPYNCIVFALSYNYYICIPYRTEISHSHAFHFRKSQRSIRHKSGLDYTKMIIVKNSDFIDPSASVVDNDEYIETITHIVRIKDEAFNFLETYKKHITGEVILHPSEFNRRYSFSTLKYFHEELAI